MTKPVLHLVVSDVRPAQAVGATGPDTPKLRDYAAVDFGSGWYHEAAIAACEPSAARVVDAVRAPARAGLTLVP